MKKSLTENVDYYLNAQGFMVLTEKYHLERGSCCGNGCLHCPYEYSAVVEPRRTQLLQKRARDAKENQ